MNRKRIRKNIVVLWDFDGTLVDTMKNHTTLASKLISKYFGIKIKKAKEKYLKTTGLPFDKQLEILFPGKKTEEKRKKCAKEYHQKKIVQVYKKIKPIKGSIQILKKFSKLSFLQFILSGTDKKIIKNWLTKNKIKKIKIFGKEEGIKLDHIRKLRKKFPNSKFFLIADSEYDLKLPVDFKIAFASGKKEREILKKTQLKFLINNLFEVEKILIKLKDARQI